MTGPVYASAVYPVTRRFIGIAKEATPGTATSPTFTLPVTKFDPKDNITYLKDTGWRNAMADLYNLIQGVEIGELDVEGAFFGDGIGYPLVNILGDYYQAVNGAAGTATTLASGAAIGATTVSVTSATGLSIGMTIAIGALGTNAEEVRTILNLVSTTVTLSAPLYQAHAISAAVTPYVSVTTYVHNFSLLNNGLGAGGWSVAQPQTQSWTDYTGVTAGTGARTYAYTCFSELALTSAASGLYMWDGKATSIASAVAGTTPTASVSTVKPEAAWQNTVSIASTAVNTIMEWKLTLTRKLDPKFTNSGQQQPFAIPRGELNAALSLAYDPAVDESGFLEYLNNTQPTIALTTTNGLSGSNLVQSVISMQVGAYDTGVIDSSKTVFGYNMTVLGVANTTNVGPSGGYSPLSISLTNNVVNY